MREREKDGEKTENPQKERGGGGGEGRRMGAGSPGWGVGREGAQKGKKGVPPGGRVGGHSPLLSEQPPEPPREWTVPLEVCEFSDSGKTCWAGWG